MDLTGIGLYAPSASALRERYVGRSIGSAVQAALDEGAQRVAVTLGAGGALVAERSGAWRVAGVPIDVVSTLGAGDVFHGALLASLLDGGSLAESARRACAAAALSCRALDGRAAIPTRDELDAATHRVPVAERVDLDGVE
jgi:sugar/nucleoside kinase (ribokinase family)